MIKNFVRAVVNMAVNRARFNDTALYANYQRVFYPEHFRAKQAEVEFYRAVVGEPEAELIFDVGASVGAKARVFAMLAKKVVCVEANPRAVAGLEERFLNNPRVEIAAVACGACEGVARLHLFEGNDEGYNTISDKWVDALKDDGKQADGQGRAPVEFVEVPMTTLDRLIAIHGAPRYIKIDVEGYEREVVSGLTARVPMVSIECNLPVFRAETLDIIGHLCGIGLETVFNFATTEPPARFESPSWLSRDQMIDAINSDRWRYMEIYCKSRV